MWKVIYKLPAGMDVPRRSVWADCEAFEDELGKPPPGFGPSFIDIMTTPLEDESGIEVVTYERDRGVLERLPAVWSNDYTKGEIVAID